MFCTQATHHLLYWPWSLKVRSLIQRKLSGHSKVQNSPLTTNCTICKNYKLLVKGRTINDLGGGARAENSRWVFFFPGQPTVEHHLKCGGIVALWVKRKKCLALWVKRKKWRKKNLNPTLQLPWFLHAKQFLNLVYPWP